MPKFCTECGSELKEGFKFCPNCGADVSGSEVHKEEPVAKEEPQEVIVCDVCGEENPLENEVCGGCGAKLEGGGIKKEIPLAEKQHERPQTHKTGKKQHKQKKTKHKAKDKPVSDSQREEVKELDSKKIFLVTSLLAVLVIVIFVTSGILDSGSDDVVVNPNVGTQTDQSGVSLQALDRINELEAKVKANPEDTKSMLDLANLLNDSGFYQRAINYYQKYLDKVPSDPNARIDMGVCYYVLQDYDSAIREMKKALEYAPKHQIGHLNLGIVNLATGNVEEAMSWFRKAVEIDPNSQAGLKAQELLNSHNIN